MTNNTDNLTDRTGRPISKPRDLSKTHKRAYIVSIKVPAEYATRERNAGEEVFYVKNEWEAKGHMDTCDQYNWKGSYHPCMVSNALYNSIG